LEDAPCISADAEVTILTCIADCAEHRVDRVYLDAATSGTGSVYVAPGHGEFLLEYLNREGFRDLGVWNPMAELPNQSLSRNFVAYSSGAIARPVK